MRLTRLYLRSNLIIGIQLERIYTTPTAIDFESLPSASIPSRRGTDLSSSSSPGSTRLPFVLAPIPTSSGRTGWRDGIESSARGLNATCRLLRNSGARVGRQAAMMAHCDSARNQTVTLNFVFENVSTELLSSQLLTTTTLANLAPGLRSLSVSGGSGAFTAAKR